LGPARVAAADRLLDHIARNPDTDVSRMLLAACYGHLGRTDDARAVWAELLNALKRSSPQKGTLPFLHILIAFCHAV
jgi:adenylate cyclase